MEEIMPEPLKNLFFTTESINRLIDTIRQFHPTFDKERFLDLIHSDGWEQKELKEKMRHTTRCLFETLPQSYGEALDILKKSAPQVKGFEAMSLPDFVELYGMENWELSLPALGHFTRYSSSEFGIRPFLDQDPERAMEYMMQWAEDDSPNVRRLASEGCRPRLPWAMALPRFKTDPTLIFPILEKLKNDESETVRRSVANNLNDISKDNPDMALDICEKWYGENPRVDAIVKHACRTLLKAGNKRALVIFGYSDPANITLKNFQLEQKECAIGDDIRFNFTFTIDEKKDANVRLEYAVDFVKANGKLSRKVFKITENRYKPGEHSYSRKQSMKDMSTRKHHPGTHYISLIINGEAMGKEAFDLHRK